jgi:hypothetical protein
LKFAPTLLSEAAKPWPLAEVIKVLAESGMAIATLAFTAFTFLYASLLAIREDSPRANQLRAMLRHSLYGTASTVVLSVILTACALGAMFSEMDSLAALTIFLSVVVGLTIAYIVVKLAWDVYREGRPQPDA